MHKNKKKGGIKAICLGTLLFILVPSDDRAWDLALEFGIGNESTKRGGFAIQWEWNKRWFAEGDWYLGGYWEASFSYLEGKKGQTGNSSLFEGGVTPVLRFQCHAPIYGVLPYLEAGVGVHGMSQTTLGDRDFSIPFAFGSHVGVGMRFGGQGQFELGYRFQHLSNAELGDTDPGINFNLLRLG